jgi:ribonuclease HI
MNNKSLPVIDVYTDGSCDTQFRIGAWVAIILHNNSRQVISGTEVATTHNRMELVAVINAIQFIKQQINEPGNVSVFSDSQYVTDLPQRRSRLVTSRFLSRKGTPIQNELLVKLLFDTLDLTTVRFEKVRAHQKKKTIANYNIEADLFVRKMVREKVKELTASK